MTDLRLFPGGPRSRTGPDPSSLSDFEALDSSARERTAQVRETVERWFARLPPAAQPQIRERFLSRDRARHLGAFFEIYMHELLSRLDFNVVVDIGNDDSAERIPDFQIASPGVSAWVEATALLGHERLRPADLGNERIIEDLLNAVGDGRYWLDYRVIIFGKSTPGKRLTRLVAGWLHELTDQRGDWIELLEFGEVRRRFHVGDWVMEVSAMPVQGEPRIGGRMIGGHGYEHEELDDVAPLRRKVLGKAAHYGKMDRPLVLAVLDASTFLDDGDVHEALFGRVVWSHGASALDGVWTTASGPRYQRLSAVLIVPIEKVSRWEEAEPVLWRNPWAYQPVSRLGPWKVFDVDRRTATTRYVHPPILSARQILSEPG